jgi:hypothetical protein
VFSEGTVASGEFQVLGVDIQRRNSHSQQFVLNVGYPIARLFTNACVWHINALVCLTSTKINPDYTTGLKVRMPFWWNFMDGKEKKRVPREKSGTGILSLFISS